MNEPKEKLPEFWLRGPVENVLPLLQPLAHALLQAKDEIHLMLADFPAALIWKKPAGVAAVAFHLQHIGGVLDRLFTYSQGDSLSAEQLKYLSEEGKEMENIHLSGLLTSLDEHIDQSIQRLKEYDERDLTQPRTVGRKKMPSTVMGLLFHAVEHSMRHTGQMLVTVRIVKEAYAANTP